MKSPAGWSVGVSDQRPFTPAYSVKVLTSLLLSGCAR